MEENMTFEELQEIVSICLEEILNLKQQNEDLRQQIYDVSSYNKALLDTQKELAEKLRIISHNTALNIELLQCGIDNLKYELNDPRRDKSEIFFPQFFDIEETVDLIVQGKRSMARFGDGEFALMSNKARQKFQCMDKELAKRLREVIQVQEDGMLIGIADNYGALDCYTPHSKLEIRHYMTEENREEHIHFLDKDRKYHNAYISRPYALFADNKTDAPKKRFENLKRIWNGRDVIFIEGSLTRLGVGNDLFDNVAQIQRIEAPPTNSFEKYDEILQAALHFAQPDTLFLIALGPSAGVLAYDLYCNGYQAVDVGHVDLEYEWYLRGEGDRCEVKNKYNNEFPEGDIVENIDDKKYLSQIVYWIVNE